MRVGRLVSISLIIVATLTGCDRPDRAAPEQWQPTDQQLQYGYHWQRFNQHLVDDQFRVIDRSTDALITTSEGQVYGMLFSLFANQPEHFSKLLTWLENNLADGDLTKQLPAWQWGYNSTTESWTVLDSNSASDVDILLIYALYHAAEVWQEPDYQVLASALSQQLMQQVVTYQNGELLLLPAPIGFAKQDRVTINPSYAPLFVLDGLYQLSGDARWLALGQSQQRLMLKHNPSGVVADWLTLSLSGEVLNAQAAQGSYDAIRSYYWFALDPSQRLLEHYLTMAHESQSSSYPPETLDWFTGTPTGEANIGFSAALIPYFKKTAPVAYSRALQRIKETPASDYQENYYDQVLILFGLAHQQCFAVNADGTLNLFWVSGQDNKACYAN
ncbi:cellulase (glycosyl hydrolase family 8) [Idiomarina fontislapidosi]|uniref:cellulase n=1 Tax=Idiomarina fontislapidosi TaxID=263723 RepID=A0A432Y911_9GAMM|nr:cellulose synthase complex periplasmic endoglucanase BcsZ [Idiomarina fontislapidosi]PYE34636.1 cellulase (glycosyl hydrolase family 8) [Idiomarina fontislapidosi]RUO57412.1 cellulase [Idiomarina fontislapidosi]|tara:strand:- start:1620 stop:2780 length:1161 start_codon:yes stop_codon:yes gene_type:complete